MKEAVDLLLLIGSLAAIGSGCSWLVHPGLALIVCGSLVFALVVGVKLYSRKSASSGNAD